MVKIKIFNNIYKNIFIFNLLFSSYLHYLYIIANLTFIFLSIYKDFIKLEVKDLILGYGSDIVLNW